jgi:hypothetical protein
MEQYKSDQIGKDLIKYVTDDSDRARNSTALTRNSWMMIQLELGTRQLLREIPGRDE